jgi:hypothetical protein
MTFYVEDKGGEFERCPPGMHLARCYRIVDLGTQKKEFKGVAKLLHQITIYWEIHGTDDDGKPLRMSDGRPFGVFQNYTLSWSSKANLRIDLQSWRGRPFTDEELRRFDLKTVLGAWCMLNLIESTINDGKTYVNVKGVTPVPALIKNNGLPEGVNPKEIFQLDKPDMAMFDKFHEKLKAKIMQSPEWQKLQGKTPAQTPIPAPTGSGIDDDDDIPFN